MPLPLVALAAAPALAQFYSAFRQNQQARRLKLEDTTTPAEAEVLAMGRQAAVAGMPGEATALARLDQGVASGTAQAMRAASGSSGALATIASLNARRAQGVTDLADQRARYQVGQQGILRQLLARKGQREYQDRENFAQAKAALTAGAAKNAFGGLSTLASAGVMGLSGGGGADLPATPAPTAAAALPPGMTLPGDTPYARWLRSRGAPSNSAFYQMQRYNPYAPE